MKTAFITGSEGGIGSACAALFRDQGWRIIGFDRSRNQDASRPDDIAAALAGIERLDAVIHAAGSVGVGGIEDHSLEQWHAVMDSNLTSAFVVCRETERLLGQDSAVVLFSSVNGRHGGNRLSGVAYATAKAGILGLVRHLAKDKGARGIRYNAVAPGPVSTPMLDRLEDSVKDELRATMPLNRLIAAEEIAGTVAFLCSPAAGSITGATIDIGGIWMG
ncbi:SDR family NAD(P)-dependent oxidoreductase [Mesorhizobium australicum]|uniref:SDR family NAD(P)-dependent oxidoreductase n=1 Tax=Mesorhizobium australicum TaxID=536018 RepID=UPI001593789D|nr:SDR family oxidoreductase [Mesorhizobium australicum]